MVKLQTPLSIATAIAIKCLCVVAHIVATHHISSMLPGKNKFLSVQLGHFGLLYGIMNTLNHLPHRLKISALECLFMRIVTSLNVDEGRG